MGFLSKPLRLPSPDALQEVFLTGGLPPLVQGPDQVYSNLFHKVAERNRAYYEKYAEDVKRVKDIVRTIAKDPVALPSGGRLSVLRLRQLGQLLGFHDTVHEMITRMTSDLTQFGYFTRQTLAAFEHLQPFDNAPLYAVLHEAIYARRRATNWSADRVIKTFPAFMNTSVDNSEPIFFLGEMIFREMFQDYTELTKLLEVADIIATKNDWPELYDEDRLATNKVPVYSSIYTEDMYVHFDLAKATAAKIKGCKTFITNIFYHDALGSKTDELMKRLFDLRDDVLD